MFISQFLGYIVVTTLQNRFELLIFLDFCTFIVVCVFFFFSWWVFIGCRFHFLSFRFLFLFYFFLTLISGPLLWFWLDLCVCIFIEYVFMSVPMYVHVFIDIYKHPRAHSSARVFCVFLCARLWIWSVLMYF